MNKLYFLALIAMLILGLGIMLSCGDDDDDDDSDGADDDDGDDDDNDSDDDDSANDDDDETDDDADDATGAGDTWTDPSTGLMWQNGDTCCFTWYDAVGHCEELTWDGHDDWRLPTISELRSLVRECDATVTGGSCDASDECPDEECAEASCLGCEGQNGPGPEGRYWPKGLKGSGWFYWAITEVPDAGYGWFIYFYDASVYYSYMGDIYLARCVR